MAYKNIVTGVTYYCPECDSECEIKENGKANCTVCIWSGDYDQCEEDIDWKEVFCPPGN